MTVGDKLAGLVRALLDAPPSDPAVGASLKLLSLARRFGLHRQIVAMLPPLEDEDAWHQLLARVAGVCLALPSEGVEIDADVARLEGQALIAHLLGLEASPAGPSDADAAAG